MKHFRLAALVIAVWVSPSFAAPQGVDEPRPCFPLDEDCITAFSAGSSPSNVELEPLIVLGIGFLGVVILHKLDIARRRRRYRLSKLSDKQAKK